MVKKINLEKLTVVQKSGAHTSFVVAWWAFRKNIHGESLHYVNVIDKRNMIKIEIDDISIIYAEPLLVSDPLHPGKLSGDRIDELLGLIRKSEEDWSKNS